MSLVESYAVERRARLMRLGAGPRPTVAVPKPQPKKRVEPIDASLFYPQMWMYDLIEPRRPREAPTVLSIRDAVCKYFGILPLDVESSRRQGSIVYPRQVAFYLARIHTPYSYPQIGRRFGDRDHTTIMHGVRRITDRMKTEPNVAYDISCLEAMI